MAAALPARTRRRSRGRSMSPSDASAASASSPPLPGLAWVGRAGEEARASRPQPLPPPLSLPPVSRGRGRGGLGFGLRFRLWFWLWLRLRLRGRLFLRSGLLRGRFFLCRPGLLPLHLCHLHLSRKMNRRRLLDLVFEHNAQVLGNRASCLLVGPLDHHSHLILCPRVADQDPSFASKLLLRLGQRGLVAR